MSFNTIIDWNGCSADQQQQLLTRPAISASDSISKTVTEILNNVKANGDAALREYSAKFDKTTVAALQVSEAEIAAAGERLSDELKQAMAVAVKTSRPSTTRNSCRRWMSKRCRGALPAGHPSYRLRRTVHSRRLSAAVLHGADAGDAGAHRRLSAGGALLAAADCR